MSAALGDDDGDYKAPSMTQIDGSTRFALYLTQALDTAGLTVFLPLYPYYFALLAGFDAKQDGLEFGVIASFGQLLGSLALGMLSDRFGRKRVIVGATLAGIGCAAWTALAASVWVLAAARLVAGLAAGTGACLQAYVADVTALPDRPREIGRLGALSGLGLVGGPALGIAMGYALGVRDGFWLAAVTSAALLTLNVTAVLLFLPESPRFSGGARVGAGVARRPVCGARSLLTLPAAALIVASMCASFVFILMESVLPLLLIRAFAFPPWQLIVVYGGYMAVSIALQMLLFAPAMRRWPDKRDFVTQAALWAAAPLIVALACTLVMVNPCLSVALTERSGGRHGALLGARAAAVAAARAASPLVNGPLYDVVTPLPWPHALPFGMAALALLAAAVVVRLAGPPPHTTGDDEARPLALNAD